MYVHVCITCDNRRKQEQYQHPHPPPHHHHYQVKCQQHLVEWVVP
jgi:hypothetical protein